jgi:hypothetical protein
MSERRPSLAQCILTAVEQGVRDVYTMIPAKVTRVDLSRQQVDCQVLVKNVTEGEDEERQVVSWPVVTCVPIQFPGANGYRMTFPVTQGDTGALVFSHRSLDKWLTGSGAEVDPQFDHDHGLNDAIFLPGLKPFGQPWQSCPTDHMTVGADTGQQLHLHSDTIVAGDEASAQFVALANLVKSELSSIASALSSHTHTYNPGPGTAIQTAGTSSSTYSAGDVKGSVLKAKP